MDGGGTFKGKFQYYFWKSYDLEFISTTLQILNVILLISVELYNLRTILSKSVISCDNS